MTAADAGPVPAHLRRRRRTRWAPALAALLVAGCAAQEIRISHPVTHPAHPDAVPAPEDRPAPVLAPDADDAAPSLPPASPPSGTGAHGHYICSMCPGVVSETSGRCPNCGMRLVEIEER